MSTGERRPRWRHPLTRAEMTDALAWRRAVMHEHWPSLSTVRFVDPRLRLLRETVEEKKPDRTPSTDATPRPPGVSDAHPMVQKGRWL